MAGLDMVGALIDGGATLHGRLVDDHLKALGFAESDSSEQSRLVVGPAAQVFAASYRLETWQADGLGRLVWFWLDSEIPHMSTIVACVGIPSKAFDLPLFVMNLNLKVKAGTFNTIMGFRGPPDHLTPFRTMFPDRGHLSAGGPAPELIKDNPQGFTGIRCMFMLRRPPVVWSLGLAWQCLDRWFDVLATGERPEPSTPFIRDEPYFDEAVSFHSREGGGVYDAVFGRGWLGTLFRDRVFG